MNAIQLTSNWSFDDKVRFRFWDRPAKNDQPVLFDDELDWSFSIGMSAFFPLFWLKIKEKHGLV
ncbi:hypothetical protein [Spirosoma sp.]|uniref:hypothetical protein n=1 Tax=Spirosoma sp. TaxID=1899569 RepID=UPI00260C0317|nr:hypothetical protein [Spirosoma sp.]MCX6213677.1 hypothetical protein [Spirosoma sp.]